MIVIPAKVGEFVVAKPCAFAASPSIVEILEDNDELSVEKAPLIFACNVESVKSTANVLSAYKSPPPLIPTPLLISLP